MKGYRELMRYAYEPPKRLIVGLGELGQNQRLSPANFGFLTTSRLISNCYVALSDIHDPSMAHSQSRGRNVLGVDKVTPNERLMKTEGGGAKPLSNKGRETWDTTPFMAFGGLFCDRLLLGSSPPHRVAAFQPHSSPQMTGQGISKIFQHYNQLDVADLLVICSSVGVEFGGAYLSTLRGVEKAGLVDDVNMDALLSINESLSAVVPTSGEESPGLDVSVMVVGLGAPTNPHLAPNLHSSPLSARRDMSQSQQDAFFAGIVPKLAFAASYWCSHPEKAAILLNRELVASRSPSSGRMFYSLRGDVRDRIAKGEVGRSGQQGDVSLDVLQTMQRCLFSTRDQAILEAYDQQKILPGLLDLETVERLANKILLRAYSDTTGYRARRPTSS